MRIDRDELLMGTARLFAQRSTCSRGQVGVVISRDARILSSGYNGAPAGMPHCNHERLFTVETEAFTNGKGCTNAVHAEANAIAFAAKNGVALAEAEIHTTLSPCLFCSQLIVNAGIRAVTYQDEYRLTDGLAVLGRAGVGVLQFTGV